MQNNTQDLISRLRDDLLDARKSRNAITADAIRSVLNAIDNAGAIPIPENSSLTEAPRRELTQEDINTIIKDEINELHQAAEQLKDSDPLLVEELDSKAVLLNNYFIQKV